MKTIHNIIMLLIHVMMKIIMKNVQYIYSISLDITLTLHLKHAN